MRVLVTAASKHGATAEIADVIAATLDEAGHHSTSVRPGDITGLDGHDAIVIGSAVYAGRWRDSAKRFVTDNADALRARPVWLFSSGPLGEPPEPTEEPVDVADLMKVTGARDHQVFAGKLDRSKLRFAERAVVRALRAPEGEFRDFDRIRSWARDVAHQLDEAGTVIDDRAEPSPEGANRL